MTLLRVLASLGLACLSGAMFFDGINGWGAIALSLATALHLPEILGSDA